MLWEKYWRVLGVGDCTALARKDFKKFQKYRPFFVLTPLLRKVHYFAIHHFTSELQKEQIAVTLTPVMQLKTL